MGEFKLKNVAHVQAGLYLMFDTELTEKESSNVFNKETIVNSKVEVTLPDGSVLEASFADMIECDLCGFDNNMDEDE